MSSHVPPFWHGLLAHATAATTRNDDDGDGVDSVCAVVAVFVVVVVVVVCGRHYDTDNDRNCYDKHHIQ